MGNTTSENIVKEVTKLSVKVVNDNIQSIDTKGNQSNIVEFSGNCKMYDTNISQVNRLTYDLKGFSSGNFDTKIQDELNKQMKQKAESVTQNLSLNPASTRANNITNIITELSNEVVNTYKQNCSVNMVSINKFTCKGNADLYNLNVSQENYSDAVVNCIQKNDSVQDIANKLKTEIDQTAKAKQDNALMSLVWLILAMGLFISLPLLVGGAGAVKVLTNENVLFYGFLIFIILFLSYVAYNYKLEQEKKQE
tara:strand:- start:257 stop:1012 length:756 start_codon:yes stop_codon:yes gene_type:complete